MPTHIPLVTDTQFAFGFRSAAAFAMSPSPASSPGDAWRSVANHILAFGLGERPDLVVRAGLDLNHALRLLGAVLSTPDAADAPDKIGSLLATLFHRVQPQGGPLATAD